MKFVPLAVLLVAVNLGGCASYGVYKTGTQVSQAQEDSYVVGETTASDIQAELGTPQTIEQVGSEIHYVYTYQEINALSGTTNEATRFIFDARTKLLKEVQRGRGPASNPLLKG